MHVSMATDAGKAGQPNEDFAGAVPGAAVLLDGAGIPGTESMTALTEIPHFCSSKFPTCEAGST